MSNTPNQQEHAGDADKFDPKQPRIKGITCPACGSHDSIFIGTGGYLTCSWIECPEPELEAAIQQKLAEQIRAFGEEVLLKKKKIHQSQQLESGEIKTVVEYIVPTPAITAALAKYEEKE
jgi:hypothetical protein